MLACLALATLAHVLPSAPTYDPWAWINWGREIVEADLDTRTGPSWKPLPVLFTTPFALAGDEWAPDLWLIVAQAGGLLAFAFTYRLAARLAGWPAGIIAAAGLVLADEFIRNFARGNSEGLLVALVLWAVERHLDGRRRDAFVLGFLAGLLRPELWPFLLLYGALADVARAGDAHARRGMRRAHAGCCGSCPSTSGSGDFFRAASRARDPNPDSAAFADFPFLETFRRSSWVLMPPLLVGAAIALVRAWRERDRVRLTIGGVAAVLMIAVAAMTQAGFAGNLRYVALPAALVCVLAGAGWVDLVRGARARWGAGAATGIAALLLAASAPFIAQDVGELRVDLDVVRAESELYDRLPPIVAKSGGRGGIAALRAGLHAAVRGPGRRLGDARALVRGRDLRGAARHHAGRALLRAGPRSRASRRSTRTAAGALVAIVAERPPNL